MNVTPRTLKWVLRFYPPFFFQRIWVRRIYKDFVGIDIKIHKSLLNINSNKTVFGGTIFSAMDPIHSILLNQAFRIRGMKKTVAWLKSAQIDYLKPGHTDLYFSVKIDKQSIDEAYAAVKLEGKVIKTFTIEVFDRNNVLCAVSNNEIYIRDLTFPFEKRQKDTLSELKKYKSTQS